MRYLRAAGSELLGLFVSDWLETLAILVILAAAWFLLHARHATWLGFALAVALGLQLVYMTARETNRRSASVKQQARPVGDTPHDDAGQGHLEAGRPPGAQGEQRLGGTHQEVGHQ